jgi:hypothetical protein
MLRRNGADRGPGSSGWFIWELVAFVAHVGLCWAAFMLLPCSEKKGEAARAARAAGTLVEDGTGGGGGDDDDDVDERWW